MSDTKHTPGPWKRGAVDYTEDDIFGANGVLVAAVCGNDGSDIAVPQVDADARLIAACPEMYEAVCAIDSADTQEKLFNAIAKCVHAKAKAESL